MQNSSLWYAKQRCCSFVPYLKTLKHAIFCFDFFEEKEREELEEGEWEIMKLEIVKTNPQINWMVVFIVNGNKLQGYINLIYKIGAQFN